MKLLENHYRDMCDIEFTIEQGRLFMLQTRVGKRTAAAALRMAVEMDDEGLIDKREAVLRVAARAARPAAAPAVRPEGRRSTVLAKGLNASPGAAVGKVYFTADDAEARARSGRARDPRAARDVARRPARHDRGRGHPHVARRSRVATRRSSRAAWARPRSAAPRRVEIDLAAKQFVAGGTTVHEGDVISISGTTGEIVRRRGAGGHARADRPLRHRSSAGPTSCAR